MCLTIPGVCVVPLCAPQQDAGAITAVALLHQEEARDQLMEEWANALFHCTGWCQALRVCLKQPLGRRMCVGFFGFCHVFRAKVREVIEFLNFTFLL